MLFYFDLLCFVSSSMTFPPPLPPPSLPPGDRGEGRTQVILPSISPSLLSFPFVSLIFSLQSFFSSLSLPSNPLSSSFYLSFLIVSSLFSFYLHLPFLFPSLLSSLSSMPHSLTSSHLPSHITLFLFLLTSLPPLSFPSLPFPTACCGQVFMREKLKVKKISSHTSYFSS